MKNSRMLAGAFVLAAIGIGVAACSPATSAAGPHSGVPSATAGHGGSALGSGSVLDAAAPGHYVLQPMPAGTVAVNRGTGGRLLAQVNVFGLTPGSSHDVAIESPSGRVLVRFPVLTANAAGAASTTLSAIGRGPAVGRGPAAGRFVIDLGSQAATPGAFAASPIAVADLLPFRSGAAALRAVTHGAGWQQPSGRTTISYDAAAQTLAVTVTAYGLTPGPHAAHIHLGSCQNQGAVKYMLADFTANQDGAIIDQTRVVTGVPSVPGPGNWYLNLHLGGMAQILANGMPTLYFRPLLCTNISTFAVTRSATPSSAPSVMPSSSTMPSAMPSVMPSSAAAPSPWTTASALPSPSSPGRSPVPSPSGSGAPSPNPTGLPTHW